MTPVRTRRPRLRHFKRPSHHCPDRRRAPPFSAQRSALHDLQRLRRKPMGIWLSEREQRLVAGAEAASAATPIPTQIVSNGEYLPPRQSSTQKRVEARINELADANARRLGLSRRQFFRTGCGMAAAFVAMNEIYGNVFQVTPAEAREPELIQARAQGLAGQFIFDVQTHFVRDDFDHKELLGLGDFASQHWNPKMKEEGL